MGARFTERAARAAHLARGAHAIALMAGPAALLTIWLLSALPSALAGTLEVVQERGILICGVRDLGPALSTLDEQGRWTGFYPEFCHAGAAAAIGDKDAVECTVVSTVDRAREDGPAEAKRLLGAGQDFNVLAGLDRDWAYRVVRQVGNYGEVFDRTLGTTLGLERGLNALWQDGGLLWAPPVR